jgi:hypothetical protein
MALFSPRVVLGIFGGLITAITLQGCCLQDCATEPPTPAPTSCADTSGDAAAKDGSTCDDWTTNPEKYCPYAAEYYDDKDFTATEMCCVCHPHLGTGPPKCVDTSGDAVSKKDSTGQDYSCDDWLKPEYCTYAAEYYDDKDFTVTDMCCICGGGTVPPEPTESPAPVPTSCADTDGDAVSKKDSTGQDYSCVDWLKPENCVYAAEYYDDKDFTATDMCCICGGGDQTARLYVVADSDKIVGAPSFAIGGPLAMIAVGALAAAAVAARSCSRRRAFQAVCGDEQAAKGSAQHA